MHRSSQTVDGLVRNADGLLLILELLNRANGAKDLLLDDLHVLVDIGEDRRLDEVALVAMAGTAGQHLGAGLLTVLNVAHDPVKLQLRHLRALEGVGLEGVADLVGQRALLEALQELVVDRLVDQNARAGAAALAVVEVDTKVDPRDGVVNVGIREDNVGRLATQLQGNLLQVALGRGLQDAPANQGRAGEGDLIDVHVVRDGSTGDLAETREDVDHTRREAGLLDQLGGIQTRQRRLLGRLQHDGVTGRNGRTNLPGPHEQREVPRNDLTANADGFMTRVGQVVGIGVDGLANNLVGPASVVAQAAGRVEHVALGLGQRLAVVE